VGDDKTSCVDPPKRKDAVGGLAVSEQELSPEKNLGSQIELAYDAFLLVWVGGSGSTRSIDLRLSS